MSGTVTVRKVRDWLTPFRVEVAIDGRKPSEVAFHAAARAQSYATDMAAENDLSLVYVTEADEPEGPIVVTPEMFAQRVQRVCSGCRESKPLSQFRSLYRRNRSNGATVHYGWADECVGCEEVAAVGK